MPETERSRLCDCINEDLHAIVVYNGGKIRAKILFRYACITKQDRFVFYSSLNSGGKGDSVRFYFSDRGRGTYPQKNPHKVDLKNIFFSFKIKHHGCV